MLTVQQLPPAWSYGKVSPRRPSLRICEKNSPDLRRSLPAEKKPKELKQFWGGLCRYFRAAQESLRLSVQITAAITEQMCKELKAQWRYISDQRQKLDLKDSILSPHLLCIMGASFGIRLMKPCQRHSRMSRNGRGRISQPIRDSRFPCSIKWGSGVSWRLHNFR